MRKSLLALVAVVLLAACGDPAPTPTATGAQAAFNDADVRFLQAMIPHQAAEIQTMEGWLQRWQQPLSATNQMAHEAEHVWGMMSEGELDWLAGLAGREFDLGFTTSMKTHHLGAIKMTSSILQEGRSPEVRMLASQILTAQQDEVDQLTRWHDAWS